MGTLGALLFAGKPRHEEGLGVEESVYLSEDEDRINAAIYARQQSLPLPEVLADFRAVHNQLLTALQPLTDSELMLPYRHFLPDEPGDGGGPPGINVIYGNSAHHYRERWRGCGRWLNNIVCYFIEIGRSGDCAITQSPVFSVSFFRRNSCNTNYSVARASRFRSSVLAQ